MNQTSPTLRALLRRLHMLTAVLQDRRHRQAATVGVSARSSLLPGWLVEVLQGSSSYYAAKGGSIQWYKSSTECNEVFLHWMYIVGVVLDIPAGER